ncbi:MAG: glycoside hydrolase domain-containing protein, partial [bacterium]
PSPLPPANWAGIGLDDGAWPRVRLPLPTLAGEPTPRPQTRYGATAALLVRGKFEVMDPAQVKSCRLSLDYLGGVVVYVNGKEAVRRDVPGDKPSLLTLAADYPEEAFTTPKGDYAGAFPPRERSLRDFEIPAGLLREGVNVLAIETHTAPVTAAYVKRGGRKAHSSLPWVPIGLLHVRLSVTPIAAATANLQRPRGIRVWNCAAYDTLSVFDFGDPCEPLRPVAIQAARNSVFSGRLMVSSDQPIQGLKVKVSDLYSLSTKANGESVALRATATEERRTEINSEQAGAKLPASAFRVRYAVAVVPGALPPKHDDDLSRGKSHLPPHRFDGLLDVIPPEIPVSQAPAPQENYYGTPVDRKSLVGGAVAPLWFTVRVPCETKPGEYQGQISIEAEGLPLTNVPLRVSICDWTMTDTKDFRMHNMAYHDDMCVAAHYGIPLWSDKHLEMVGRSHTLMAEAGSRYFRVNLENLVRWIKQPDGSFKYDFTLFDKYLDMIAKSVGKPQPLRLQAWGDRMGKEGKKRGMPVALVPLFDPATGKTEQLKSPNPNTDEAAALAFWKPVFDGVFKRIKDRGWMDTTAFGLTADNDGPDDGFANLAEQLWPDGVWAMVTHEVAADWKDGNNPWVKLRYACGVYDFGWPSVRGYRALLRDRPVLFCNTYRSNWRNFSPLTLQRRVGEDIIMSGRDGVSDFGADLFMYRDSRGVLQKPGGPEFPSGPGWTQHAMLYPGPDGPVATERYEMFREGVELAEALIFIERAVELTEMLNALLFIEPPSRSLRRAIEQEKRLSPELQQRAEKVLKARSQAFIMDWFTLRDMPGAGEDAKLLNLAGEVARELEKK